MSHNNGYDIVAGAIQYEGAQDDKPIHPPRYSPYRDWLWAQEANLMKSLVLDEYEVDEKFVEWGERELDEDFEEEDDSHYP